MMTNRRFSQLADLQIAGELEDRFWKIVSGQGYDKVPDKVRSIGGELYLIQERGKPQTERRLWVSRGERRLITSVELEGQPDDLWDYGRLVYHLRDLNIMQAREAKPTIELKWPFSDKAIADRFQRIFDARAKIQNPEIADFVLELYEKRVRE